jgi:CheY-like chemotaxis protein
MIQPPHVSPNSAAVRRALVIEDVESTRQRIAGLLRHRGYYVDEAINGLDALKKLAARRFDVILLDLVLPEVDGWQFRQAQLRHPDIARIPTVVVTVRPLRDHDRYALKSRQVVLKPFEDHVLLDAVSEACGASPAPPPTECGDPDQL